MCDDKLHMRTTQASQNQGEETWSCMYQVPNMHIIYEQTSLCKMQADAEGSHGFLTACTNQCRFNRFALHLTSTHCNCISRATEQVQEGETHQVPADSLLIATQAKPKVMGAVCNTMLWPACFSILSTGSFALVVSFQAKSPFKI